MRPLHDYCTGLMLPVNKGASTMKRVILTSSSGVGLAHADRADMVVPFIYRFVSGPLPLAARLDRYLGWRESKFYDEVHWSNFVRRSPFVSD